MYSRPRLCAVFVCVLHPRCFAADPLSSESRPRRITFTWRQDARQSRVPVSPPFPGTSTVVGLRTPATRRQLGSVGCGTLSSSILPPSTSVLSANMQSSRRRYRHIQPTSPEEMLRASTDAGMANMRRVMNQKTEEGRMAKAPCTFCGKNGGSGSLKSCSRCKYVEITSRYTRTKGS